MTKKGGLGKGLDAIFAENDIEDERAAVHLKTDELEPNRNQPRRSFDEQSLAELAAAASRAADPRRRVPDRRGGAPLARGAHGRAERGARRRARDDRRAGHGARADREPAARGPEPAGRGAGLPDADGLLLDDAGRCGEGGGKVAPGRHERAAAARPAGRPAEARRRGTRALS